MLFLRPPLIGRLVPTPTPIAIWAHGHTPTRALNQPSLFIGHQALPGRVPRVIAVVPLIAAARVHRPPCATATRVHRSPCAAAASVRRQPPIVDHAHSPPTLSGAVPPSSLAIDLGHRICVLRMPPISRGASLSVTFFPRSTGHHPSIARLHTPP
jgi:hypothetical protein